MLLKIFIVLKSMSLQFYCQVLVYRMKLFLCQASYMIISEIFEPTLSCRLLQR